MKTTKCPNCKREILYNYYYHCYECASCEKTYNGALQELRPVSDWKDEYDEEYY